MRGIVAVSLAATLAFIVISNYLGWTARIPVKQVSRNCDHDDCYQKVVVEGRAQAFKVPMSLRIAAGDLAEIRGSCTPSCKLELLGSVRAE